MHAGNEWINACHLLLILMVFQLNFVSGNKSEDNPMEHQDFCRVSGGLHLKPEEFALYACATCYKHMDERLFENGTKMEWRGMRLRNRETGAEYEASYSNRSSPIFRTFRTAKLENLWIRCCQAAVRCCEIMRETPPSRDPNVCHRTWDGWNCWFDTPSGQIADAPCPSYIYFHSDEPHCQRYSTKKCLDNATWYRNRRGNEFSDYTTCGQGEEIKALLNTHVVTFGISIVLLIPALGIFFYYRQLRVYRIFMHKNLFISVLFTGIFVIIFESYFIVDSIENPNNSILESNQASCKIFYTLTKYMRLSTYMWMFCEGFYLHKLIAAAFAEQKSFALFHVIGWGFPVIPVGVWAIIRKLKADELCWTVPANNFEWILFTPMLAALVVNFCFLAHIIQVIVTKLRSTHADEPTQFRRAVRATMVLIPLFGLHFLLLCYHPKSKDCYWQQIYNIVTYSMDGLQGGLVALIFCYFNNEVLFLLKRSYNRQKMVRDVTNHSTSRKARESRTSMSTNVDCFANEGGMIKK